MEHRELGRTGLKVSALGFGGSEIGFASTPQNEVDAILSAALDAGLNVIDTGECYGESETLIGNAVSHRRDEFHLFTKCGHASGLEGDDWNPQMLEKSIERSLQRLKTDRVDLIQLHSCSLEILQRGEVIEVLQQARDAGKTRFIGYSGDNEAALYAIECGAFDALQTSVNIADINDCEIKLPRAQEAGIGVIAKRPIANAVWRYGDKEPDGEDYHYEYWRRMRALDYNFLSDSTRAASVALRWTLAQPAIATAIVGTTNPRRWRENAQLLEAGPLEESVIDAIHQRWHDVAGADWKGQG